MFEGKKFKDLEAKVSALSASVEALKALKGRSATVCFPAKITSITQGAVNAYAWKAVKPSASGYAWADDPMFGQSGSGTLAYCTDEADKDMTGKDPMAAVGNVVLLYFTPACYCFSVSGGGISDVRYDPNEDKFYKTKNGQETVWAESTLYPPSDNE